MLAQGVRSPLRVVVAVASFRRPRELLITLGSVNVAIARFAKDGNVARLLVVDNDPDRTAHPVCHELGIEVVSEPTPGIAAARNRALDCRLQGEHLAFIDDDEAASSDWIVELTRTLVSHRAAAVFGPVLPVFPEGAPGLVVRGGFFDRKGADSRGRPVHPATNNVLIAAHVLDASPDLRFNEAFSLTGGSDTDFFKRLREMSPDHAYAWSSAASVDEFVPRDRATVRWIWRRNVRLGNVSARIRFGSAPKVLVGALGLARVLWAVPATALAAVTRMKVASAVTQIPKGLGMIQWAIGSVTVEYARVDKAAE